MEQMADEDDLGLEIEDINWTNESSSRMGMGKERWRQAVNQLVCEDTSRWIVFEKRYSESGQLKIEKESFDDRLGKLWMDHEETSLGRVWFGHNIPCCEEEELVLRLVRIYDHAKAKQRYLLEKIRAQVDYQSKYRLCTEYEMRRRRKQVSKSFVSVFCQIFELSRKLLNQANSSHQAAACSSSSGSHPEQDNSEFPSLYPTAIENELQSKLHPTIYCTQTRSVRQCLGQETPTTLNPELILPNYEEFFDLSRPFLLFDDPHVFLN